jgi:two-component system, OmpR family, sensor histidine kinase TctE
VLHPAFGSGARRHTRTAAMLLLAALSGAEPARSAEPVFYPAREAAAERLRVFGATDLVAMQPLLADFQALRPDVAIEYHDLTTHALFEAVTRGMAAADIVISSAMDLQVKLVNDGWTQPHVSEETGRLPRWANWRNEAFGFTYEPAVIVYRRDALEGDLPRSRRDLTRRLLQDTERLRRRVATYDPAASGVGYLFATQDSVLSSQYWRLVLAFGNVQARLFGTSAEMLDALERGEVAIAYNVLGSYARTRADAGAPLAIVPPEDYTLVMSRVATIPRTAGNARLGKEFLEYLLSNRGQTVVDGPSNLDAILSDLPTTLDEDPTPVPRLGTERPIALGPQLLVFLDPMKRRVFLEEWWLAVNLP